MKTILYSCADLAYDQIFSPVVATPGVAPVLFTDRRPRFVSGWQWRPLPEAARGLGPSLANRFCKFFPQKIFPQAEYSIYIDANLLVIGDLRPLLDAFIASGADIALFRHKDRADVFAEFEFCKTVGKIPPADFETGAAQLRHYQDEGLPRDQVFTENAIIFRRHGAPALAGAMELWWQQFETYTKRDQLSLPYVLHKSGLKTLIWDWSYWSENPYFSRYIHRHGLVGDISTYLKNKRHYNAFYRTSVDSLFFVTDKVVKPFVRKG